MGIKNGMIANELQLVEEVLSGKKDIPEYFTIKDFSLKIFRYFYYDLKYSVEESCKEICNFLESRDILFSKKEVYAIPTWYKLDKGRGLRSGVEPIRFYKSEVSLLKQCQGRLPRQTQRLGFAYLLYAKFQQQYTNVSEPTKIYRTVRDMCILANVNNNSNRVNAMLIELGQKGLITAPLTENCIYCNMLSDGSDDLLLEIYNFEPNMIDGLFEVLFGKLEIHVLAIPVCEEEDYFIDTMPNVKRKLGLTDGNSDIKKCCDFNGRFQTKGYMFFKVDEEDSQEFLEWIVKCFQQYILINYKKMKKNGELEKAKVFFNSNVCREYYKNLLGKSL